MVDAFASSSHPDEVTSEGRMHLDGYSRWPSNQNVGIGRPSLVGFESRCTILVQQLPLQLPRAPYLCNGDFRCVFAVHVGWVWLNLRVESGQNLSFFLMSRLDRIKN